ncbi:MAG: MraY family glycosyltransferase [Phycisphaerales bacterium]
MNTMVWMVLALAVVGMAISLPATALLCRIGHRLGALDSTGAAGHTKQLRTVPNIGGVGIFLAVGLPLAFGVLALHLVDATTLSEWFPGLTQHLPRLLEGTDQTIPSTSTAAAMLGGMIVLHVLGLIDDRRNVSPWVKLAIEVAVAAAMAIWFDVRLMSLLGTWPSVIVTILWIVLVINAINFMDNMDGLAGGVSAIAAALFMAACIVNHQWFIAATLALLMGGLIGFLVFNFPPAKIFMGDGGSFVVGFILAVLTARTTYYDPLQADFPLGGGWYGVFMPLIVLAIPLYDFTAVTFIRLKQGRNPLIGDQQHFSHRLVQRGLSPRGAVVVIWSAAAVTGIGGVSLGRLDAWQAALVGAQTLLVLIMIALLEHTSRRAAVGNDRSS